VAAGSLLSGRLLSTRLSRLLIAASLIAMSVLSLCLSVIDTLPSSNRVIYALLEVVGLGFFAGMYIVPMYVWIQQHTPLHHRAAVLGLTNMFNALFMIAASLLILVGLSQGLTISRMFGVLGYLNAMFLVLMLIGAPSLVSQQHSRQS
jgi:MFS family permease